MEKQKEDDVGMNRNGGKTEVEETDGQVDK